MMAKSALDSSMPDDSVFTSFLIVAPCAYRIRKRERHARFVLLTDGWTGYPGLTDDGYRHDALTLVLYPTAEAHLPMIHLVFSNLKT